jgi:dolichyl-phosphate beta-glucosyltransferase
MADLRLTLGQMIEPMSAMNSRLLLSLIIPAFNEELRIARSLERILAFCNRQRYEFEVIVVDDGSTDETVKLIRERFEDNPQLRIIEQPTHRGKGAAVKSGMLQGYGDYLIFSDADLSVPIEMLPDFLSKLQNQHDAAIGSRRALGAKIEVHQSFLRETMGKAFTLLSNLILGLRHSDVTCGFKGFRREVAQELFSRQRLNNWSFDSEILFLARCKSYRVSEIPVTWRNDEGTKVRIWKDVAASFLGVLAIRWNQLRGRYR